MPGATARVAELSDSDTGPMLAECLRLLTGADGPERAALLSHLRVEAEPSSRCLFARELATLVRRGRAGWRRAAGALAELGAEGPTALGDELLGCRSAAAQGRLLEALAGAAELLPEEERAPLLMLISGLWFAGRTPAVKAAALTTAQRLRDGGKAVPAEGRDSPECGGGEAVAGRRIGCQADATGTRPEQGT